MQTQWAQQLNPLIANEITQGLLLSNVTLASGADTVIPTGLNRLQQGWIITDKDANANIWRTAAFNNNYLTLRASAAVVVSIWVF